MSSFNLNTDELNMNLEAFKVKALAAMEMYGPTCAAALQAKAKRDRPWTDRTTRARGGLTGSCALEDNRTVNIVLAHTVDYGLWLELAHEKNYAVVEPTVRLEQQAIINGLEGLLNKIHL